MSKTKSITRRTIVSDFIENKNSVREETKPIEDLYEFVNGIENPIGKGSYGKVHKVRKKIPGLPVRALKEIRIFADKKNATLEDVIREVLTLYDLQCDGYQRKPSSINNNNTYQFNNCAMAHVYDWFTLNNRTLFYVELEYVLGGTGHEYAVEMNNLVVDGNLTDALQRLTRNFGDLVATMLKMHRQCILHRDIKPANLLYDEMQDQLIFSDFGLSCFLPQCQSIVGTEIFIDPFALYEEPRVLDERSDIYSLGSTMYELITGEHLQVNWKKREEYESRYQGLKIVLNRLARQYKNKVNFLNRANVAYNIIPHPESPLVMLEAVRRMLNPWFPNNRPTLPSILNALESGNIEDIQNFDGKYSCNESYRQLEMANAEAAPITKKVNCDKEPVETLQKRAIEFLESLLSDPDSYDAIEYDDDLVTEFSAAYKTSDRCLYEYSKKNIAFLWDLFQQIAKQRGIELPNTTENSEDESD